VTTTFAQLPSFADPPVREVAASVQFDPLAKLTIPMIGLLWQRFRSDYPTVEQQPPLPPAVERLGVRQSMAGFSVQSIGVVAPRLWFVNSSGDELVQVQNDRFIRNWRHVLGKTGQNPYPRYIEHVRPRFLAEYGRFLQFLIDENLGTPDVNQCELTYVNQIFPTSIWSSHAELAAVFRGWAREYANVSEYPVETIHLTVSHVMQTRSGEFVGRLHVGLNSAYLPPTPEEPTEKPVFLLTLTARGRPLGVGEAGIVEFMDLAHRAIVTSFDKMTTPEAHAIWRKES
jgi:uncharacterized protein (TIGR04255 family)